MVDMNAQAVLAALKEEAAACDRLASLRQEQRRLIDAGQAEGLLEVLARKQQAIEVIGRMEEQLRPLKADWERRKNDFPASQRIALGDAFRQVRDRLEQLIARETEDADALASRMKESQEELDTFDRKRQLGSAYRQSAKVSESRMFDCKDA